MAKDKASNNVGSSSGAAASPPAPVEEMTAETGTYRWMAPEVINHLPYDHKVDVFSFAIVLWELLTAKIPYDTMTPVQAALGVRQVPSEAPADSCVL